MQSAQELPAPGAISGETATQSSPPPLSLEQLQLLQLCFGEHEFGMRALESRHSPLAASINDENPQSSEASEPEPVVLDFDPVTFIREKSEHGITLDVLCRDLVSFERYLQGRIMQHVHEDVYQAFVSVSGELAGVEDQLKRILQPLSVSKAKVEHAVDELSARESRVLQAVQAAELSEQRRVFHLTITRCFLMHENLVNAVVSMESQPYIECAMQESSASGSGGGVVIESTQPSVPVLLPSDQDLTCLTSVAQDLYELMSTSNRLTVPLVSDVALQRQYASEVSELKELVDDVRAHIINVWNHVFLSCHRVYMSKCAPQVDSHKATHVLRVLMELYAPMSASEFFALYRDQVVRPLTEDVLSWRASAQARTSMDQCIGLLDELKNTLETTVMPMASLIREVFGALNGGDVSPTSSTCSSSGMFPIPTIFWPPICNTLVTRLVFLFLPGIASTFHRNFVAAHSLVSMLEMHCTSVAELQAFRGSTETTLWSHKWNLDVYHTLRASEATERATATLTLLPQCEAASDSSRHSYTSQSGAEPQLQTTVDVMDLCMWLFSSDVFLFPIGHRLLREAAFVIRNYTAAATHVTSEILGTANTSNETALTVDQVSRIAQIVSDLMFLSDVFLPTTFRTALENTSLLTNLGGGSPVESKPALVTPPPQGSSSAHLNPAWNVLSLIRDYVEKEGVSMIQDALASYLVSQCQQSLQNLKTVKAAYSHTKKPLPSSPSWFVSSIIEPVSKFKSAAAIASQKHSPPSVFFTTIVPTLIRSVVDSVSEKFRELTKDVIISARRMEESLGRLRRKREEAKGGAAAAAHVSTPVSEGALSVRVTNENATDRDKMVVQLYLDAHEYGSLLRPLGVNKESYEPLQRILKLCRRANWILSGDQSPEPAEVEEDEQL